MYSEIILQNNCYFGLEEIIKKQTIRSTEAKCISNGSKLIIIPINILFNILSSDDIS